MILKAKHSLQASTGVISKCPGCCFASDGWMFPCANLSWSFFVKLRMSQGDFSNDPVLEGLEVWETRWSNNKSWMMAFKYVMKYPDNTQTKAKVRYFRLTEPKDLRHATKETRRFWETLSSIWTRCFASEELISRWGCRQQVWQGTLTSWTCCLLGWWDPMH